MSAFSPEFMYTARISCRGMFIHSGGHDPQHFNRKEEEEEEKFHEKAINVVIIQFANKNMINTSHFNQLLEKCKDPPTFCAKCRTEMNCSELINSRKRDSGKTWNVSLANFDAELIGKCARIDHRTRRLIKWP